MKSTLDKFTRRLTLGIVGTLFTASLTMASSHREAPLISNDPLADNTDVYAFRSPDDPNTITIIANYIPMQLPHGGPNYYAFGENVRYEIHIDNDVTTPGDDITYRFTFTKINEDPTTFFNIRLGAQNQKNTYTMEKSMDGGASWVTVISNGVVPPYNVGPRSIEGDAGLATTYESLFNGGIMTASSGESVFAGPIEDPFFVDLAGIFDLGDAPRQNGMPKDGLACYNVSTIALKINIADLQKDGLSASDAANILDSEFVIGVWASASRQQIRTLTAQGTQEFSGDWVQVSRLGMPLTNEAVIAIGDKDYWNSITPYDELNDLILDEYFYNPELSLYMDEAFFAGSIPAFDALRIQKNSLQSFGFGNTQDGLFPLKNTPALDGTVLETGSPFVDLLLPAAGKPRSIDLWPIFHTGVPNARPYQLATGKEGNPLAEGKPFVNNFLPNGGDMLRLNMAVPITDRDSEAFSSLGLIAAAVSGLLDPLYNTTADLQFIPNMDGFPNGRRLEDDVTRIELQAVAGVVLSAIGLWEDDYNPEEDESPVTDQLLAELGYSTGVEANDVPFRTSFPYVQMPFSGTSECSGRAINYVQPEVLEPTPFVEDSCTAFKVYYINIDTMSSATKSTLYEVMIDGGNAELVALDSFPTSAHLGISTVGELYIVFGNGKLSVYDVATGTYSTPVQITFDGAPLMNIPHVALDPETDEVFVASADTDAVYSVDPLSGAATLVAQLDVDVRGGDLVFTQDGTLWLVNRLDGTFYNITDGGAAGFSVDLNNVNGVALLEDGTILAANTGSTAFNLIDASTGEVLMQTIETGITFGNGDLAAGCTSSEPVEEGCFASEVLAYNPGLMSDGQPITDPERLDSSRALGAPQLDDTFNFVSLGYGGNLIIGFGGVVMNGPGADISVAETTFGNVTFASYPESANVFVTQNGVDYFLVGSLTTKEVGMFDIDDAGQGFEFITAVKIMDTTPEGSPSDDGFDVDGVEALNGCAPFPDGIPGGCEAGVVLSYVQGTQSNGSPIATNRTNSAMALGTPEGTDALVFVTLGYGGSLILAFDGSIPNEAGDDIEVVETSFGTPGCLAYREYADVYVSQNGVNYFFTRTICKSDNMVDIDDAGQGFAFVNFVKIVNNDELSTTPDGFDVDGVRAIHNCEEGNVAPGVVADFTESRLSSMPNPSDGRSTVTFNVSQTAQTTLDVYDMSGRNVSTLFNQVAQENQEYRISFEGAHLPIGVYIFRLNTGSDAIISKFMIAR